MWSLWTRWILQIASSDISSSVESPSLTEVKSGSIFRKLHEILPANRSNLSANNQKQNPSLKLTNTQFSVKNEIVDLTGTSNRLTAPYFQKKRKLGNVKTENLLQRCESSCESRNREGVQECCSSLQVKNEMSSQNSTTQFGSSQSQSSITSSSPPEDQERKGSTFLLQVNFSVEFVISSCKLMYYLKRAILFIYFC